MDDLGNRDNVNLRDTTDVNYVVDLLTNRYNSVGGDTMTYDRAGNMVMDKDDYEYEYDYENRLVRITKDDNDIAYFAYDALGRRIEVNDVVTPANTQRHYYGSGWQVLCVRNSSDNMVGFYYYGNDIDEVIFSSTGYFYVHDHLGSVVALANYSGVVERYEYDAYGEPNILDDDYSPDADQKSDFGNPYMFTGRRVDYLDDGDLKLQYNRNRYYGYYTGRWTSHDPMGYVDGMNLYEYVKGNPIVLIDQMGLGVYREGPPTRPNIQHDNGFLDDFPPREPTWQDYALFAAWRAAVLASYVAHPTWDDGRGAYLHYLHGNGEDYLFSYDEFVEEDSTGQPGLDIEIFHAQRAAERIGKQKRCGETFQITGSAVQRGNPATENWQKAIGKHVIWGSADVKRTCKNGKTIYSMDIVVHAEDRYNFNPGEKDIGTRIPDAANGRFQVCGLAHQFDQFGESERRIEWEIGHIENPEMSYRWPDGRYRNRQPRHREIREDTNLWPSN